MATIQTKIDRFALLEWLISVKQEEVWEKIAQLKSKISEKPPIISDAQLRESLTKSIAQANAGEIFSHDEVEEISSKW
jgi:predicted transcriptional regulator